MAGAHQKNNLDFFRLFFAVAVIFSHSFPITQILESREPFVRLTDGGTTLGALAVAFFFIISGFLVSGSRMKSSSAESYIAKRCLRIFPGYVVAAAISVFIVAPLAIAGPAPLAHLIAQAVHMDPLTAPGEFAHNPQPSSVNGVLWTIRYEFYCYLIVVALFAVGALQRPLVVLAFFVASLFMVLGMNPWCRKPIPWIGTPIAWSHFLPFFLAGCTLYQFRERIPRRLALFVFACFIWYVSANAKQVFFSFAGQTIFAAYAIFYLGFHERLPLHHFGRFGDFSYGTYLYAWPIQQLLVQHFGREIGPWRLFWVAAPLAITAGAISWHLVERPFLRLKDKRKTPINPLTGDDASISPNGIDRPSR